ncbi:peroxiredoxin-6-like [Ceratitis capitata]|uniref:peroxiredoxin-6-like n=1 Tax=Ceratitis capitata TaxID=7213 RepID=UPI00032A088B|nr:peroxiredoxin-6-like [Ceratitis capitata]
MRLGAIVPNFRAETSKGLIDFYGWQDSSWVVLLSHPRDFTPVCTTELGKIALLHEKFAKRNVKCIALSVDGLQEHLAWISDIKSYFEELGDDFPYPLIADPQRDLAVSFGMLNEDDRDNIELGKTIRTVYVIDPDHKVRLTMCYPMTTGRNIDEILRVIDSMQLTDRSKILATPVNWTPGSKVMLIPSVTDEEAKKFFPNGFNKIKLPSGKNYLRTTENY